ncbi:MAG: hypothetical protein LBM04_08240 [Opitutaceae bacterium]|jgi:hypothetical protein|nr:hypothetical protein [Opitutaceae bacterium]
MLVGKTDGYLIMVSAGMIALMLAPHRLWVPTLAACLAAGTGAMEVHGARLLAQGDAGGVNWLVRAQLLLMLVILAFASYYLSIFNEAFFEGLVQPFRAGMGNMYAAFRIPDPFARLGNSELVLVVKIYAYMFFTLLGMMTCVYQGLMARYYHKRRAAVATALDIIYGRDGE